MKFSTRSFVTLMFWLSLAGTAFAQSASRYYRVPEIDIGSAVSAIALLMGSWALLGERLRSK